MVCFSFHLNPHLHGISTGIIRTSMLAKQRRTASSRFSSKYYAEDRMISTDQVTP